MTFSHVTIPKSQQTQIIFSHKYRVLYQTTINTKVGVEYKVRGLTINNEKFSRLCTKPPSKRFLFFHSLHFATPHLINLLYIPHKGTYIRSKRTKAWASTIVHPCKKVMYVFGGDLIPLLDNAPKSQPSRGKI